MRSLPLFLLLLWVAFACSDSTGLPDATIPNAEQMDTLYSLVGTPVATPSGFSLQGSSRVRTDLTDQFDFAYNIQPDGSHVFLPRAALGIDTSAAVNPGFQTSTQTFEAITIAPSNGYISDQAMPLAAGNRYLVRSRITCSIGVPKYGKIEIVSFDDLARTVAFRILVDDNCGFKGLEPGLPKN